MHYHGYKYTGPGEPATRAFDPARRHGTVDFETATVPPDVTGAWLAKPARMIAGTWDQVADAVAWLSGERTLTVGSVMNPELMTGAPSVEAMESGATALLSGGSDVVWAWWLKGGAYASFSVVCCPNRHVSVQCPVGPGRQAAASARA